ncbi:MAG: Glu-tRNA(Gln) amidotransferase subunit GatE [Lentimicrobium sp.]|jgi:glutamyl-tRNA(Gln) amidotransferase subunit E|nr:Glu-tRNA(Gln) amidotransferase subunit GatE [Lentimicrobium sp.]MDD2527563.1 Glu-tRNA(Gln) amidotransferase subunit GatE [Lentimicrobiaceae bacterium]MDD4597124.1 Glu-tRNA(Gln) amidotransferase subunit GatE [Lentimicrobiaceae bacterium]MDY0025126.1 Glu-tRNA(Gln) amidotransferase subunit GatE [Lentimicrobium sp.]
MKKTLSPRENYDHTCLEAGYVPLHEATHETYDRIGFMSGLEVHQQLKTKEKLFCHCPAGIYNKPDVFDAEVIRHMRPTLSELGEYDGTALMEFKTRKNIIYRLKNETTCTYEVDDTPPFALNREALNIAIEISLLSKLNIVGEVHITRKQYLDGSIPTGFQRTAIIGVEGEISLKNKKIRLIQLSLEEDSCREVSDIGHTRIYRTDRLGMPLIETVTYPDMVTPAEVKEACDYIRFLNRSTGKVRTGIGAARQDVNVSCRGGSRVEIKGVAHTKWIPQLTHIECFRQWSLLLLRDKLCKSIPEHHAWKCSYVDLDYHDYRFSYLPLSQARHTEQKIVAVNLPGFGQALSHFTQPGKMFADELSDRLKVIACLEKPNMVHTAQLNQVVVEKQWLAVQQLLGSSQDDAQLIIWGHADDIPTALETIEERCLMAFKGIPTETRKSFEDGTTIFERVLPGADRMYPDTDSAPIPLKDETIEKLRQHLPREIAGLYSILQKWRIPEDTYTYIFKNDFFSLIEDIVEQLDYDPAFVGKLLGHKLKFIEGHIIPVAPFKPRIIFSLLKFLKDNNLTPELAWAMLPIVFEHPKLDFESVLIQIKFQRISREALLAQVPFLRTKFAEIRHSMDTLNERDWIMGQLRRPALGNIPLTDLVKFL